MDRCVGVVKPHQVFEKNPSQHAADYRMIECSTGFEFLRSKDKRVECIRVDGTSDERPSVKEVQFLWTETHLTEEKVATCVTARYSGGSYLNRVELMNGCLAHAHSNLFIPCTLAGSNYTEEGLNEAKLYENLDLATDIYIDRVNGAPCGEATIELFKGSRDMHAKHLKDRRSDLVEIGRASCRERV